MQTFGAFSTNGLCLFVVSAKNEQEARKEIVSKIDRWDLPKDYHTDWIDNQIVRLVDKDRTGVFQYSYKDDEPICNHAFFSCRVPSGDSCQPIYHQVCQKCHWDQSKGIIMPESIWHSWAVAQIPERIRHA